MVPAVIVAVSLGGGRGIVGPFRSGYRTVASGEVIGLRSRFTAGVGGAQCDPGGGEQEDRAGQQGLVEACGERLGAGGVGGEQGAGAGGGYGREDREPQRGPQLL